MEPASPSAAESVLARVKEEGRARFRLYIGAAPGVGKSYRMLEDAHQLRRQGVDVVIGFIEPHGRADTKALVERSGAGAAARARVSRGHPARDGCRSRQGAPSQDRCRRRAGAHQRPGVRPPETLRRRHRPAGRRHRRHLGGEHPAHRVAERRDRVHDRRARPRDDSGLGAEARRRSGQRRCLDRNASRPAAAGQDLRRGENRTGPVELLSQGQSDGASRAGAPAARHRSGGQGTGIPGPRGPRPAGHSREGDGGDGVPRQRQNAAPRRLAHRRAPGVGLVCRVRGDPAGGAGAHRAPGPRRRWPTTSGLRSSSARRS